MPSNPPTSGARRGVAYACLTASLWGVLAIALKFTLRHVDPFTIVWFRFTLAFGALLVLLSRTRPGAATEILRRPPPRALLAGGLLGVNYLTFMKGVELTSASNTQVLIQTGPMLLVVAGLVLFRERLSRRQILGYAIAACGFGLFYRSQLAALLSAPASYHEGNAWIGVAAVSWVGYAVLQKSLIGRWTPQQLNLIIYIVPAVLLVVPATPSVLAEWSAGIWVLMLCLGLNTLVAYGALAEAFKLAPVNVVSTIITLNPIITMASMAILQVLAVSWIEPEPITAIAYVGAGVMLSGVLLVVATPRRSP